MEIQISEFVLMYSGLASLTIITGAKFLLGSGIKGLKQTRIWLGFAIFSIFAWGVYLGIILLYSLLNEKNPLLWGMGISGLLASLVVGIMILRLIREVKEVSEQTGVVYRRDTP